MTRDEYVEQLSEYVASQGPNKGEGYYGKLAWYLTMKEQFNKSLKEKGIVIPKG